MTIRRDLALLLVAAAVIFALLLVARGTPQATTETAWREPYEPDFV